MSAELPRCCQQAALDGISEDVHRRVCREPQKAAQAAPEPEPAPGTLFDLPDKPKQGGQHL